MRLEGRNAVSETPLDSHDIQESEFTENPTKLDKRNDVSDSDEGSQHLFSTEKDKKEHEQEEDNNKGEGAKKDTMPRSRTLYFSSDEEEDEKEEEERSNNNEEQEEEEQNRVLGEGENNDDGNEEQREEEPRSSKEEDQKDEEEPNRAMGEGENNDDGSEEQQEEEPRSSQEEDQKDEEDENGGSIPEGAKPFVLEDTMIRKTMVTEKHSFVYLQRGPFPQSAFVTNRGEYDLECQSVAVATEELFSEQGVNKKVKDLEKKRK